MKTIQHRPRKRRPTRQAKPCWCRCDCHGNLFWAWRCGNMTLAGRCGDCRADCNPPQPEDYPQ